MTRCPNCGDDELVSVELIVLFVTPTQKYPPGSPIARAEFCPSCTTLQEVATRT